MATVFRDLRIDERTQMILQLKVSAFFVCACQSAIANDISRENSREAPFQTLANH